MNVVNLGPGPGNERQTGVEDAVVMEGCSPVTCEGNAEQAGFYFWNLTFTGVWLLTFFYVGFYVYSIGTEWSY
jgi:hypothetical protein